MKRTRIAFEDIKAGDLLEVEVVEFGVKSVMTGIAFQLERMETGVSRDTVWWSTSEGGMVVNTDEDSKIYRINVGSVGFDDVRAGDVIRVTSVSGDVELTLRGRAAYKSSHTSNDYWLSEGGEILCYQLDSDSTIEILEREAE